MKSGFDFSGLFVLDLANNHQGNVAHALNVINQTAEVVKAQKVRAAIKFQFRQLDSFIHPTHKSNSNNKHIPRFISTSLKVDDFKILFDAVRSHGLVTMCTPFDESSVDVIQQMGFDIIKVASCSAKDWPLLEKIATANKPVIFSTGGLSLSNIDDLVSFFEHRGCDFAIMHCVSIYPTPSEDCHLNQIQVLRDRYPGVVIGWSTHEDPNDTAPVMLATAKGAQIYERHIGIQTDEYKLNNYSSIPQQISDWISAQKKAVKLCGSRQRVINESEVASLNSLKRGVFANKTIKSGDLITLDDIYFAMPYVDGQLDSGAWREGIYASDAIDVNAPLMPSNLVIPQESDFLVIKTAIHEVKALLNEARVVLSSDFDVEYSHHYGIKNFNEHGVVIINCINREYCKKILVQLPGQKHPAHFHKLKEETFQVLYGELHVTVDGKHRTLQPGDVHLVMPGVWHSFWSETGCVFEEVSTTHYNNDSVYKDPFINSMERHERKTKVDHWGRFQLYEMA